MMEQNAIFEDRFQAWFRSLSPEGRAAALSVKDDDFLSTLIHFASLSSSSPRSNDDGMAEIDGGTTVDFLRNCNWSQEFLLSDVENIFGSSCERFVMDPESSSAKNLVMRRPSTLSQMCDSKVDVADAKSEVPESDEAGGSSSQLIKAPEVVVGENEADIIRRATVGSEAFIIQRGQESPSATDVNYTAAVVDNDNKDLQATGAPPAESILKEIQLISPSVFVAAKEHGLRHSIDCSQVDGDSSPILSLPPSIAKDFDPADLPLEGISASDSTTWIKKLRVHVETNAEPGNQLTASMSLMMLSRMQISSTEAFVSRNNATEKSDTADLILNAPDSIASEEEQSSFEQYATPPEEETSDDNEVEELDAASLTLSAVLPSNPVPCKSREQYASADSVNKPERGKPTVPDVSLPPSTFGPSEAVQKLAVESDLEETRSPPTECLPFVPLENVLRYDDAQTERLNTDLKQLISSVPPRTIEVGCLPSTPLNNQGTQADSVVVSTTPRETDADSLEDSQLSSFDLQDSQLNFGKKKKKKKKRKRKNSNADSLQGKEVASHVITRPLAVTISSTGGGDVVTPLSSPSVLSRNSKRVHVETPLVEASQLPVATSLDTDRTRQSSKETSSVAELGPSSSLKSGKEDSSVRVSQFGGVRPTCVVVPGSESAPDKIDDEEEEAAAPGDADDGDEWATVEVKGRGKNRSKPSDTRARMHNSSQNWQSNWRSNHTRKVKTCRTSASRKRHATRRIVRDVLSSVLDSVDVEVRRRRKALEAKVLEERRRRVTQHGGQGSTTAASGKSQPSLPPKPVSMRDIVLRKQITGLKKSTAAQSPSLSQAKPNNAARYSVIVRAELQEAKKNNNSDVKSKGTQTLSNRADQSTDPTLPDTLSGASAHTQSSLATEEVDNVPEKVGRATGSVVLVDDSSSTIAGGDEAEPRHTTVAASTEDHSSPPLPTLLGPGNTNSANSSVASSLEAPHASNHRHHHHSSGCNENDVGYHLLDVCDRLSQDMNVFMARRSLALTARRRERGALLTALQDTVSKIWVGRGNVEMYGSCATQLDLPSSDLDAVILGLGAPLELATDTNPTPSKASPKNQLQRESPGDLDFSVSSLNSRTRNQFNHHQNNLMHPYGRPSSNGERVMILAAELERQPWAVQVKAIPTASVPVVKILADPSKLPGAVNAVGLDGNWMIQQHHMAARAAAVAAGINPPPPPSVQASCSSAAPLPEGQSSYPPHTNPPWRGADVMNGLFSIDITFEGPEHGGIGSTKYSADVVQDACRETGLPSEGTPVVQVLMVLKELLAQRRLNEPFSGGLSSYALLLLVNAVVKERAIIREEMERIERHRELVAAEDTAIVTSKENNQALNRAGELSKRKSNSNVVNCQKPSKVENDQRSFTEKTEKLKGAPSKVAAPRPEPISDPKPTSQAPGSSWASIAKKSVSNQPSKRPSTSELQATTAKSAAPNDPQREPPPSFAEAVRRKQQASQGQEGQKQGGHTLKKDPEAQKRPVRHEGAKNETKPEKKVEEKNNSSTVQTKARASKDPTSSRSQSAQSPPNTAPSSKAPQSVSPEQGMNQHNKANSFVPLDASVSRAPSLFPQGPDDVLEVLCSGETTAGKLLMHFILYYGEHFDSRALAIDVAGTCNPDRPMGTNPSNGHVSPFVSRRSGGTIDPVTGMFTVDPIVVYDPWEGGQGHNVARSCYAWSSIQWHFAQCYMTLSSAVERSGTLPTTPALVTETPRKDSMGESTNIENNQSTSKGINPNSTDDSNKVGQPRPVDLASPLLELLLSF